MAAVTFNYRGNPLVQHARTAIARGEIGTPRLVHGHYLQDWLLHDTDYSWRLDPEKGGASSALGDIGSHWCDLAQHMTGLKITHVLGDITTALPKRKKPRGSREAFQACRRRRAMRRRGHPRRGPGVGARQVRQRRQGDVLGRPGLRRPQERSRAGSVRVEGVGQMAAGTSERAVVGPSRARERDPAEGPVAHRRWRHGDTRTCPAATRRRGRTPSAI